MKTISYLHRSIIVKKTAGRGRGVFCTGKMEKGTVIEVAPVIVMTAEERKLLDKTLLHDYIFEWGEKKDQCAMALGTFHYTIILMSRIASTKWIFAGVSSL